MTSLLSSDGMPENLQPMKGTAGVALASGSRQAKYMMSIQDLGQISYEQAHQLQQRVVSDRLKEEVPDTLLLCEHPLVVTMGRGSKPENIRDVGKIPIIEVERGGDVTLHGPGQLVGYLIRKLEPGKRDLHAHLRLLEESLILSAQSFGLSLVRNPGKTGVWTSEGRKIASLGVACRNWCTWHGFALNVDLDLQTFQVINPCGFPADLMTSISRELGPAQTPSMDQLKTVVGQKVQSLLSVA